LTPIQIDRAAPQAHPAKLNPQISELNDWRLYEAGANALGAVNRLQLPHKRFALWSRLRPRAIPGYLHVTRVEGLAGLHASHSKSAELGLALGLLSFAGQTRTRLFAATGGLSASTSPDRAQKDGADVLPVGQIEEKIAAFRRAIKVDMPGSFPAKLLWFVPQTTLEGGLFIEAYRSALDDLKETCQQAGVSLQVHPVATLGEAARYLGVSTLAPTIGDRLSSWTLAGTLALAGFSAATWFWLGAHLPLSFATVTLPSGEALVSPFRARYGTRDKRFLVQETCVDNNKLPLYRIGDWLVLQVTAPNEGMLTRWLGGYHFTIVAVSEQSGLKVFPLSAFRHGRPGAPVETGVRRQRLSLALPVTGPAEMTKIFILARRGLGFDEEGLRRALQKKLAKETPSHYINATETSLQSLAPGHLTYPFRSVEREPECGGSQ
jgi:hypothetical protein